MLFNSLTATTANSFTGGVSITGYGSILTSQVVGCSLACYNVGVKQRATVLVKIPTTCECPYTWEMTTVCQPSLEDGTNYEINNTFTNRRLYQYETPDGSTPVDTTTAAAIAANINADPNACVTATIVGATITLIAKEAGKPFLVATPSGTVTYTVANVTPLMSNTWMAKQFPLQMGSFGSQPTVAIPGVQYCLYRLVLNTSVQDISAANHYNDYMTEVEFYVNSGDANYAAWQTAMAPLTHSLSTDCFLLP